MHRYVRDRGSGVQMKVAHPTKIVALQVGDFFELTGWDAVLAIEAIGLNGMGLGARQRGSPWQCC